MSQTQIDAIIEQTMPKLLPGVPIVWPNTNVATPTAVYLQYFVIPAGPQGVDLEGSATIYRGSWQINVVTPRDMGVSEARGYADLIAQQLTANTELTAPNIPLSVYLNGPCGVFAGIQDDDAYIIPLSVDYRADVF